ncbi:MAG: ABC transporter substrate-binding protein [Polyangiaceae bacterium]
MIDLSRRQLSLSLFVSLAALAAFTCGCSKKPSAESAPSAAAAAAAPSEQKLKLALNWVPEPEFGGFYTARESGEYKKRGLDVEILGGGAGVPVLQMVATGRADFGTVGADEVVTGRARGADVVAVFATYQTFPQGIMVHAERKLTSIEQAFKSGTVALETGVAYAQHLKRKFSWDGAQIVPYDGGVARFLADKNFSQQCFVTSEPLAAKKQGGDPQVFMIADTGFNPYTTVIITRRELLEKQRDTVQRFVQASSAGWQTYLRDPGPTNAKLGELNKSMDAESMQGAANAQKPLIETADTTKNGLGSMQRERWDTLATQLVELKVIETKPNVDELFVNFPSGS